MGPTSAPPRPRAPRQRHTGRILRGGCPRTTTTNGSLPDGDGRRLPSVPPVSPAPSAPCRMGPCIQWLGLAAPPAVRMVWASHPLTWLGREGGEPGPAPVAVAHGYAGSALFNWAPPPHARAPPGQFTLVYLPPPAPSCLPFTTTGASRLATGGCTPPTGRTGGRRRACGRRSCLRNVA